MIAGSTRMKAGTATKLVLNMITTADNDPAGHVYGNLMVNVQPKNRNCADRAERIIAEAVPVLTGAPRNYSMPPGGKVSDSDRDGTASQMTRVGRGPDWLAARQGFRGIEM